MMNYRHLHKTLRTAFYAFFLTAALSFSGAIVQPASAAGIEYTVCPVGCDYTSLQAALNTPGINDDTVTLTSTYIYDAFQENSLQTIPDNVTIQCQAGASTLGDASELQWYFQGTNDITLQDCTYENAAWDFSNANNIKFLRNTFTAQQSGFFVLTNANNIEVRDNTDMQRLQIQTAHDVTIDNNTFACRFENTCLTVNVAGGPDYSDPAQVSGNVQVTNNTFNNYKTDNGGDWISVNGGFDILFEDNTLQSAVILQDVYLTMISVSNTEVTFRRNTIITPEKSAPQTAATNAFNIRTSDDIAIDALYEHNTVFQSNSLPGANSNACIGLFDGGGHPNIPVNITARYNLCHQSGSTAAGKGFQFDYVIGSTNLTLTDSFNGFSNVANFINDNNGVITTVNANSLSKNALLRRENLDTSDDLQVSPVSNYLDVDGTKDIGAYSAARETTIYLDDDCVVDYVTCHGQQVSLLQDALRDGDTVELAAGTYAPLTLDGFSNITMQGAGATSVLDAAAGLAALTLKNVSTSTFSNFSLKNATQNSSTYSALIPALEFGGTPYTTAGGTLIMDPTCSPSASIPYTTSDVTSVPGMGTEGFAFFLVAIPSGPTEYYTIVTPLSLASTAAELSALCGVPEGFIDAAISPAFVLSGGTYTWNTSGMTGASVSTVAAAANPLITRTTTEGTGLLLDNADTNTFDTLEITANRRGVTFQGTSAGNTFIDSSLTGNVVNDLYVTGSGANTVSNSNFDRTKTEIPGSGSVTVQYKVRALVKDRTTLAPLENVSVRFRNASSFETGPFLTDATGQTQEVRLSAYILDQAHPTITTFGGFNPYTLIAQKAGYQSTNLVSQTQSIDQEFQMTLPSLSSGTSSGGFGGSGGGFSTPVVPTKIPTSSGSELRESGKEENLSEVNFYTNFPGYSDLQAGSPEFAAFAYAYYFGAIEGHPDGTVRPTELLQRDQVAKMIATSVYSILPENDYCEGKAPFVDVALDDWSAQYVCLMKMRSVITGYLSGEDAGKYRPERTISRAELIAILTRALPKLRVLVGGDTYSDIDPRAWYVPYTAIAYKLELFPTDGPMEPERSVDRSEVARILYSLYKQGIMPR